MAKDDVESINVGQQQASWQRSGSVREAMISAGSQGKSRIVAGVSKALQNKMSSLYGDTESTTKLSMMLRLVGKDKSAEWIDRFFAKESAKSQMAREENKEAQQKEAFKEQLFKIWKQRQRNKIPVPPWKEFFKQEWNNFKKKKKITDPDEDEGGSDTSVVVVGTGTGSITAFKGQLDHITVTVDNINEDVGDIKSLLMPKGVIAKNKAGDTQFAQFNPLAPPGEQMKRMHESGELSALPPGKGFGLSAQKRAAKATADLVLAIIEKDKARGELRKKYEFKEEEEKVKEEDPDAEFREEVRENFDEIDEALEGKKKTGIFGWLLKLLPFAGFLTTLGKMGLVGIAAWVGTKIGGWIWDKIGVPILDAVFKIKEWWDNLDILGTIRNWISPITNAIRKITDFLHITKSDEEYAAEAAANAAEGRTRGGIASGANLKSLAENIAMLEKQRDAEKDPERKAQIQTAIDSLKQHLPKTSGPSARRGPRGQTIPAEVMAEGSDTVDTNYADVPVALIPTPPPPLPPPPSKPAVGGTGTLTSSTYEQRVKALGDIIASGESRGNYNIFNKGTIGKNKGRIGEEDLSKMTIAEYLRRSELGKDDPQKMFAVGKYQIIPDTMRDAIRKLSINPNTTTLDPATQERIFRDYLTKSRRPKIHDYLTGKSNDIDAAIMEMAKEWASVGVPHDTYRGDTLIRKGQSYYSGVGGNRAHTSADSIASVLTPMPTLPGSQVDAQSRVLQASNMGSASGVTVVNAPTVNNTKVNNTVGKRPAQKAEVLSQDNSLVRTLGKDVQHPVLG